MLLQFITLNREEIIARCRAKVAARSMSPPTREASDRGIPVFLDQLVEMLRSGATSTHDINKSAGEHGLDLRRKGYTISDVVHDYGDVCQSITDLAVETHAPINTDDFRTLNRCLDDAIASAVTIYARLTVPAPDGTAAGPDKQSFGFLVHELRNLVSTAVMSYAVLQTGSVGVGGSTGAVLGRSLNRLQDLIAGAVEEVRTSAPLKNKTRILVAELVEEIGTASALEANTRGVKLVVAPIQGDLAIDVDRQVLAAVVGNLMQNAFKFTRAQGTVTLGVRSSGGRVLIEVEDQCGGLPGHGAQQEIPPTFEQRGTDRTGLGIGLTFSRWGCEANGGRLYARNQPGTGCTFVVDLPRLA
jgi:signal transduction histidine kinase